MPRMPPGGENKSSEKGMAKASGHPRSVAEDEDGVVFKLPKDYVDHSVIRTPEK
jgi:hypothetical protein